MGDLLFCNGPIASMPYYIEGVSINIYSIEELCYFIANNTYLMDKNFMNSELCIWIEREAKNPALAERLAEIMRQKGKLSAFVGEILLESGYCTREENQEILQILTEMEEMPDFECNKIRADRLMEKDKYLSCIYEYKRLLDAEDAGQQAPELLGNIWHNLGTAYSRMFLFEEAVACYEKAYQHNHNKESMKARLFAYKCMQRDIDFMKAAREYGLDETAVTAINNEIALRCSNEATEQLKVRLGELEELRKQGHRGEYKQQIRDMIFARKEEYRRISRI